MPSGTLRQPWSAQGAHRTVIRRSFEVPLGKRDLLWLSALGRVKPLIGVLLAQNKEPLAIRVRKARGLASADSIVMLPVLQQDRFC